MRKRSKAAIIVVLAAVILLVAPIIPTEAQAPTFYPNTVTVHFTESPSCWLIGLGFTLFLSEGSWSDCNPLFT